MSDGASAADGRDISRINGRASKEKEDLHIFGAGGAGTKISAIMTRKKMTRKPTMPRLRQWSWSRPRTLSRTREGR